MRWPLKIFWLSVSALCLTTSACTKSAAVPVENPDRVPINAYPGSFGVCPPGYTLDGGSCSRPKLPLDLEPKLPLELEHPLELEPPAGPQYP